MLFAAQRGMLSGVGEPPPQRPGEQQPYRYPQSADLNPSAIPTAQSQQQPTAQPLPSLAPPPPPPYSSQSYPPGTPPVPPSAPHEYEPIGAPSGAGPQYPAYFPPPNSGSGGNWGQQPPSQQWQQQYGARPSLPYYAQRPITGSYNEPIDPQPKPPDQSASASPFQPETVANSPKAVRLGFIRKVYGILTAQLVFTIGCIALCVFHDGVRQYVQTNPTLMWIAMAGTIIIALAMACVPSLHQNHPTNLIMLAIFTALQGYLLGTISSFYNTTAVMQAVIAMAAVTAGLTLYAMQTTRDLSKMGSFLFVALLIFIM